MVTLANHVIAQAGFTLRWVPGTLVFLQYFLAKYRWRQKKVFYERGAPGTVQYVKSLLGFCITFIERLDEGLS